MAHPSDESPTERQPAKWVGSAAVPDAPTKRRRKLEDTLDLPAEPEAARPEIRYVPVPYVPAGYAPPGHAPPGHAPPGYAPRGHGPQPPPGYRPPPPQPRRRRRTWPWVLLVMFLSCLGCCGGAVAWAKPYWDQYPATAVPTSTVPGLTRVEDAAAKRTADRLRKHVDSGHLDETDFTAVYQDVSNKQLRVTVFGSTRFVGDPKRDLDATVRKLTEDLQLGDVREVDPGPFGGHQRCAVGRLDGKAVTMCGWADHGSIAVAVFTGRSLESSAPLLQNIRSAVIVRG